MIVRNLILLLKALYPQSAILILNALRITVQQAIWSSNIYKRIVYSWKYFYCRSQFRIKLKLAVIFGVAYLITSLVKEIWIQRELNRLIRTEKENKLTMSKLRSSLREQLERAVVEGNEVEVQRLRGQLLGFVKQETELEMQKEMMNGLSRIKQKYQNTPSASVVEKKKVGKKLVLYDEASETHEFIDPNIAKKIIAETKQLEKQNEIEYKVNLLPKHYETEAKLVRADLRQMRKANAFKFIQQF